MNTKSQKLIEHKKLVHNFKWNPRTRRKTKGEILMGFIYENKIVFQLQRYQANPFKVTFKRNYTLLHKNGKFNLFTVKDKPRCISYCPNFLFTFTLKNTQKKRVITFINKWLKQFKIKIKSNRIDNTLLQLCYPLLRGTNVRNLSPFVSRYYKYDLNTFCKRVCGNTGKTTKKLVIENIKYNKLDFPTLIIGVKKLLCPEQIHSILKNIVYSNWWISGDYRTATKSSKESTKLINKFCSLFTPKKIVSFIQETDSFLLNDTIRTYFLLENPPIEGNLREIHDRLSLLYRRKLKEPKIFKTPDFFLKLGEKYDIIYPNGSEDLDTWSSKMSNCVSTYSIQLNNHNYWIGALCKNGKMEYNIGWRKHNKWTLDQFVGKHNRPLTEEELPLRLELEKLTDELQK